MPKEVIYGDDSKRPYDENDPARSIVEIRWNRETGYCQIVTRCVRADNGEVYVPDYYKNLIPNDSPVPEVLFCQEGLFVDLDRRGINDLIRNLRRARDQAFGRDE